MPQRVDLAGTPSAFANNERALNEDELRRIADLASHPSYVLNERAEIVYANPPALDYTGMSLDNVRSVTERVIHPDDLDQLRTIPEHPQSSAAAFEREARIRRQQCSQALPIGRSSANPSVLAGLGVRHDLENRVRLRRRSHHHPPDRAPQGGEPAGVITLMEGAPQPVALDLKEIDLVNIEALRFLARCHARGALPLNCPPYIERWIAEEKTSDE